MNKSAETDPKRRAEQCALRVATLQAELRAAVGELTRARDALMQDEPRLPFDDGATMVSGPKRVQ